MIHVVAGVLLAAALLTAPGLLLARLGGVRGWSAASAALPLSCAVIGRGGGSRPFGQYRRGL